MSFSFDVWPSRLANGALNAVLLVLGFGVLVLLYALVSRSTTPRTDPSRAAQNTELVGDIIQVEVRNGAGVDHLAARTTQYLRDHGFDVVEVGNSNSFSHEHSLVIDRIGDMASARKVAQALGVPEEHVQQQIRRDYYLDASVIIGQDYAQLEPFQTMEAPAQ